MSTQPNLIQEKPSFLLDAWLLAVAVFWGASYPVTKILLEEGLATDELMALRFGMAILPLVAISAGKLAQFTRREVIDGILFGLVLWLTIALEVLGVSETTATNAGFLVTLTIVFVAIFEILFGRRKATVKTGVVVALAVAGSFLLAMSGEGKIAFNAGDGIIIGSAVVRGFQFFLYTERSQGSVNDTSRVAIVQFATVTLCSLIACSMGNVPIDVSRYSGEVWLWLGVLSLLCTVFAFWCQLYASKHVSSLRIAFILATEPVFAALIGFALLHETLTPIQMLGAATLLGASLYGKVMESPSANT